MNKILAMAFTFLCTTATAFAQTPFTDPRDGKEYKAVIIGDQTWMAENLNYDAKGSKCYNNKPANCEKYGRLYSWETAKNVCPSGWHLPSKGEYEELDKAVGGKNVAGKKLKAESGWKDYKGQSGNGTDDYSFSALPGGYGNLGGSFYSVGQDGYWWCASEYDNNNAYNREMYDNGNAFWNNLNKSMLLSVRCIKD
jgi:uncharacterized protein (TIGR02145 family)